MGAVSEVLEDRDLSFSSSPIALRHTHPEYAHASLVIIFVENPHI